MHVPLFDFFHRRHRKEVVYFTPTPQQDDASNTAPPPPNTPGNHPADDKNKPSFFGALGDIFGSIMEFFKEMIGKLIDFFTSLFNPGGNGNTQGPAQPTAAQQNRQVLQDGQAPPAQVAARTTAPAATPPANPQAGTPTLPAGSAANSPTSPRVTAAAPSFTVKETLVISDAVNNLSLANFKDQNPATGTANRSDHDKLAADLKQMPNISFFNKNTGQYESIKNGTPDELTAALANDPDKRFRIDLGDGKSAYIQQVLQVSRDGNSTGFAGGSFRLTDEAGQQLGNEALIGFPGYTGKVDIGLMSTTTDGTAQSRAMEAISHGQLNPQHPDALKLASDTLKIMGPDTTILVAGDSMGDSNMRVAGAFLKGRGMNVQEIALEGVADSTEVARIKEELGPNGALRAQFAALGVTGDVTGLDEQARKGGIDLRSQFDKNGHSYYTAEAGVPIGHGLLPGLQLMGIKDGAAAPGEGNVSMGDTRLILDITKEGFQNPQMAGHTGVGIMQALMHNDQIYIEQAGLAVAGNAAPQSNLPNQPATATPQRS